MELLVIIIAIALFALIFYAPEQVMQTLLAGVWLMMGCGVLFTFGWAAIKAMS